MIKKYITRIEQVEAVQYTGNNFEDIYYWTKGCVEEINVLMNTKKLIIETHNGFIFCNQGDYIIKHSNGNYIVCCEFDFHRQFELKGDLKCSIIKF